MKKKAVTKKPVEVIVPTEPGKIYVYKRDWKLLQPVPWKIKKINFTDQGAGYLKCKK